MDARIFSDFFYRIQFKKRLGLIKALFDAPQSPIMDDQNINYSVYSANA